MHADILTFVCNRERFGYAPLASDDAAESYAYLKSEHLLLGNPYQSALPVTRHLDQSRSESSTGGGGVKAASRPLDGRLDRGYVINLARRADRRERISSTLDALNVPHELMAAVDGTQLTNDMLVAWGVNPLPGYKDPYSGRSLNMGEIGCFMSHYLIWKAVGSCRFAYRLKVASLATL